MHPLVMKELREHRWVLLVLWLAGAAALIGLLHAVKDEGSPLLAFQQSIFLVGSLSILTLANRLVVREYSGRTQLFLETLPVSRAQVVSVKWLMGAALLAIPMAVDFAIVLRAAVDQVDLTSRFVELIAVRAGTFLLFGYALAFFIALTGRYRFLLWVGIVLGAYSVDSYVQLPIQQWPPVALVSESMVYERLQFPVGDLAITWLTTALLIAATFVVSLAGEGSLVLALSQRMSPRERVGVTVVLIALLSLLGQLDARKPKPAFSLHDAVVSGSGASRVAIARTDNGSNGNAKPLADMMSTDLGALKTYLSLRGGPGVFVLPDESMDADVFLRATLPSSDGVVVRGATGAEDFDSEDFRAYAIEQTLQWYSHNRAQREERRWVLDGFSQWWIARASIARQHQLTARAAMAARRLRSESTSLEEPLHHWLVVREQLGDCLSNALAWRAVALLLHDMGSDRFREFATTLFGRALPNDARAAFIEPPFNYAWRQSGALALPDFAEELRATLQAERAFALDPSAQDPVDFETAAMRGGALEVHYSLRAVDTSRPPFAVLYAQIGPWQAELDHESLARIDATRSGVLPHSFQRGAILFAAIEQRDPKLSCVVRRGARRWELR